MSSVVAFVLILANLTAAPQQPADNAAIFARGQAALSQGDLDAAEKAFRQVLATEPHSVAARANLGVVYMRRKNWVRALAEFHAAEPYARGNPGLALNIGLAYFHQANYPAASAAFRHVLEKNPESVQARYLLGLCSFAREDYAAAVANLQPLWSSQNGQMTYLYMLAMSADKTNDAPLEKQALDRLYEIGKNSAGYHLFLGRSWMLRQKDDEALRELRAAADADPKLPFVHYSLGTIYAAQGNYEQARNEFLLDAQIEPDLAYNYEELGDIAAHLNQPAEARESFVHAIQLDPHSARAHLGLAKLYHASHDYSQALRELEAVAQTDPNSASLHYLRAQLLAQTGQAHAAQEEFKRSAALRKTTRDRLQEQISGRSGVDAQMAVPQ